MTDKQLQKAIDEKAEYLKNEVFITEHPDAEKIQCKDCMFRDQRGADRAMCECYPEGVWKPHEVLWEGAECDYYTSEKDDEE